jgi:hypothetical protein
MKQLKKELQAISKSLKALTSKTEKIAKMLDEVEKPKAKPRAGAAKESKGTAGEVILGIVKRSKKGVDSAMLQKKTGFNNQKVRDNLYKLSKRGLIKRAGRGIYVAA